MPVSYRIDPVARLVKLELSGAVESLERERAVAALLEDPGFVPGMDVLSDHSGIESPATATLVRSAVPLLKRAVARVGPFRWALVTPSDASYGMARMAEVVAEPTGVQLRAFRSLSEAEAWLRPPARK